MPTCLVCATDNPDAARFCLHCGAALTAEQPREERKVVTVLFADLVGFTSRAEQLDPEDVRAVLAPYWDRLRTELERRGGTVEKFIGDAVMALFGAPLSHEDDPLRAVGAALAIRDWARDEADVQVRIAVNTGEALVLLGARPGEGEGMAAGDVVNTAARLQGAAPINGVLVGETTYRATRDVIDYREHEPVEAKGKAEPVPVWEAVQVRSRLGMDVERATLPIVGRARELGVVVDAFERAKAEREPQLVTLVGVPGIGKSRLVGEFFARLEEDPQLVWWRQGRALPYGEGVSFWALAEMVKAQAGIDENDDEETATAKLAASVESYVDEDERAWVLDHLLPLVGVERSSSGESAPAWRRYVEGLAEARPLVMVFEDMHWADDGLLDFIDHLVDWATGVSLLVIATARPELLDRRPAWGGGKLNVSTIALTPLTDEESAQIIHAVLEQAALPARTQAALVERAGGNPLYAEQFARLYMERGTADDLPLPENVQGLIAARLDGLAPEEKRAMQDAAVLGKVFWGGATDADEQTLHSLERKGLLRRERRSSVAGETQYAFRHVLVRDVAYGQIPRAARGAKHVAAADWIESRGRADDQAELVAHHLLSARELGVDVADRLRPVLAAAARRALALHAYGGALDYSRRGLALWPEDGSAERARLQAVRARAAAVLETDLAGLQDAINALERAGDREAAAELAAFAATELWNANRRPDAERFIAHAEELLAGRDPGPALCAVLAEKARLSAYVDDPDAAEATAREALALAERFELAELRASTLTTLGTIAHNRGEHERAGELYESGLSAAPSGSRQILRALVNRSLPALAAADGTAVRLWVGRALDAAQRAGDPRMVIWITATAIAESYWKVGRWDEALERIAAALQDAERAGGSYMEPVVRNVRAGILAARGREAEAAADLERVLAVLDTNRDRQFRWSVITGAAPVATALGSVERASALFEQLLAPDARTRYAEPLMADAVAAIARCGLAEQFVERFAAAHPHRRLEAARLVWGGRAAEAAEIYALASPLEEAVTRLVAAEQLAAAGRTAESTWQLERGLAFFRAVGATKVVREAESLLAAAAAAE